MRNVELKTLNYLSCFPVYDYGFWPSFPKLPVMVLILSQTGITWPSDGLDNAVWFYLMWNMELNYFSYFPAHDLEYLGSSFSKIAIMPKIPKKQIKLNPEMALRTWVMPCLKVNYEVGEFPKLSYCPKYPRTDLTLPSDSLVPGLRLHLIWHIELRFLDYFVCVPAYDLWYFDLVSPNCAMSQIP